MRIVTVEADLVTCALSRREYLMILASLRELGVVMHPLAFETRVGASRDDVSNLAHAFFDEGVHHGIEE